MKIKKAIALGLLSVMGAGTQSQAAERAKNIVIVHGAFADGSGWEGVYRILKKDGYHVTIVQNSLASLTSDVTATKNVLDDQTGPVVLVGHSYGGMVITQAGDAPNVKALVYVAAYVPDKSESLGSLLAQADKNGPAPHIVIDQPRGIALVDRAKFAEDFAADVEKSKAEFLAASQAPLGLQTLEDKITTVAWKVKPSYYIVSSDDHMIAPDDERNFAMKARSIQTFEFNASHAVYISQPEKVARVIETAAIAE